MALQREEVEAIARVAAQETIKALFADYEIKPHHFIYVVAEYEKAKNRMTWREKAIITAVVTFITLATLGMLKVWAMDQAAQYAERHALPPRESKEPQ